MNDEYETGACASPAALNEHYPAEARSMVTDTTSPARARLETCTELALAGPRRCALFLDMDGTLLELAATPTGITVPHGLVDLLHRLTRGLDGALAIISGRRIAEIDQILSPLRLAASGVHGAELRLAPERSVEKMTPDLAQNTVQSLRALAERAPGAFAEPKGAGLAIHYRLAPAAETAIAEELRRFHEQHVRTFNIWPGQKVFEVIPAGFSKGTALSTLAATPPFKDRVPIMIGDDVGDEPAFAAAEQLQGFGLRVAGENFGAPRADFDGPKAVLRWLESLAHRLDRDRRQALNHAEM